jgi:uncharacterized protein (DUF433 family)
MILMGAETSTATPFDWRAFVTSNPDVLGGKPVVRGTSLSIDFLLRLFPNGWSAFERSSPWPRKLE